MKVIEIEVPMIIIGWIASISSLLFLFWASSNYVAFLNDRNEKFEAVSAAIMLFSGSMALTGMVALVFGIGERYHGVLLGIGWTIGAFGMLAAHIVIRRHSATSSIKLPASK